VGLQGPAHRLARGVRQPGLSLGMSLHQCSDLDRPDAAFEVQFKDEVVSMMPFQMASLQ